MAYLSSTAKYRGAVALDYAYLLNFSMLPPLITHWLGSPDVANNRRSDMLVMGALQLALTYSSN